MEEEAEDMSNEFIIVAEAEVMKESIKAVSIRKESSIFRDVDVVEDDEDDEEGNKRRERGCRRNHVVGIVLVIGGDGRKAFAAFVCSVMTMVAIQQMQVVEIQTQRRIMMKMMVVDAMMMCVTTMKRR